MEDLELLEYVQRTGGYANRGFKYKIVFWDDMETVKDRIKQELTKQLEELTGNEKQKNQQSLSVQNAGNTTKPANKRNKRGGSEV